MQSGRVLLYWPLVFGLTLTLLRLLILSWFGLRSVGMAELAGLVLGLAGQITFGLLLALPLHWLRHSAARWGVHVLSFVVVFLNVAAFHYEAVYWRLPAANVLYYAREAGHLAASAGAHAPMVVLVLEVLAAGTLLLVAAEILSHRDRKAPEVPSRFHRPAAAICLSSAVLTTVLYLFPALVPPQYLWRSRVPLLWAVQSWSLSHSYSAGDLRLDPQQVFEFQKSLGHRVPFGGIDPRYPLCGDGPRDPGREGNGRSVIFLILESVAVSEMDLVHQGRLVMPELNRIAERSLVFRDVKASGTKSIQAMPSLLAGVPPQPAGHMLWRRPPNHVEGLPLLLRQHGYRSVYLHGADLSFEQQRQFLRMAGFEQIIEYDVSESHPFVGWGYTDDVMFDKLRSWIEAHTSPTPSIPYLATLFTLSTHDPFDLPEDRDKVFQGEGFWSMFVESLRFLDEELGRFYDWYLEHEAPRGTYLVITGDHAPHLVGDRHLADHEVMRFEVPLLIHGADSQKTAAIPSPATRRGAHHDVPSTIMGLLDLPAGRCDQGLDLLMPDSRWLEERITYAVAGDQLEEFHVWLPGARVRLDLVTRRAFVEPEPGASEADPETHAAWIRRGVQFQELARTISRYLMRADAFAPPPPTVDLDRDPVPRSRVPRFVSHRGQSQGELPPELQNKRSTIERAILDGFEWVEVDVNLTHDGVPVLVHDQHVLDSAGQRREVLSLTLEELRSMPGMDDVLTLEEAVALFGDLVHLLVEIKPQKSVYVDWALARRSARIVRERNTRGQIIMDSFSPYIAASLNQHCRCPVAQDAPVDRPLDSQWVDGIALTGLDWIYVHFKQASPELIRYAHGRGLRVLVYTVNDVSEIEHLAGEWPDAIITDRAGLLAEFRAAFGVGTDVPSDG